MESDQQSYKLFSRRSGTGPPLILIHGVAGSGVIWDPIIPILEKQFEVIRIDLLGYGHSPKPKINYTLDIHLNSIRNTMIDLGLKSPYTLIGLSMGALLSLDYAVKWPEEVERIVCIGIPCYKTSEEANELLRRNLWVRLALDKPVIGRIVIKTAWGIGRHSNYLSNKFAPVFYRGDTAREAMMNTYRAFKSTTINCLVNNLAVPLLDKTDEIDRLFIMGDIDMWSSLDTVKESLWHRKKAKLEILEGVSHNAVVLAPEETSRLVVNWLNDK